MSLYNPAKKGGNRVWLIEGTARPDHVEEYMVCWRAGGEDQSFGDIEKIECPSPDRYNEWVEVGEIQGAEERPTSNLMGHLALDAASDMKRIAKKRCAFDVQYHFGECTDPRVFHDFKKVVIFEDARFTNYSADEYGALTSGDQAEINESADLSSKMSYDVMPLAVAERGGDVVTNPITGMAICDHPSCGDCEDESDGCEKIYAVDDGDTGSPGTVADLLYSVDKGATWAAEDITSLDLAEETDGVGCIDDYVVVISNDSGSLHYKLKDDIGDGLGGWTEQATGFAVGGEPNAIWGVGTYGFIVGDGGYVYGCEDPGDGVVVLDAGVATTEILYDVHALNDSFAVAVGATDAIIYTLNGTVWQVADGNTGTAADLLCVWAIDESVWFVGSDDGELFYTIDGGATWTEIALPGAGWTEVWDIAFSTRSVGFLVADKFHIATPRGYLLQTINGGRTWAFLPRGGTIPDNTSMTSVVACTHDPNFVGAGGTNATDGVILIGTD